MRSAIMMAGLIIASAINDKIISDNSTGLAAMFAMFLLFDVIEALKNINK